jgi:hypothetical protein
MFRKERPVGDKDVARRMDKFFRSLRKSDRSNFAAIATAYSAHLWPFARTDLADRKERYGSRFYVGLATEGTDLAGLTKRVTLISETLLLSHYGTGEYVQLGEYGRRRVNPEARALYRADLADAMDFREDMRSLGFDDFTVEGNSRASTYGMRVPDISDLGKWLVDGEPLLRSGLAWYLPSYLTGEQGTSFGGWDGREPSDFTAIDYLVRDGRAIDASGAEPIKGELVRPILTMDLPFIEGVGLEDFSKVTVGEFDAYAAFRDYLRLTFLGLDAAMNDVQSQRELTKIGMQIQEGVRGVKSQMDISRRKRAVAATGAFVGTVGATLVAVYGPALEEALKIIGASGGAWGIIAAMSEDGKRTARKDKWYYVWALSQKRGL